MTDETTTPAVTPVAERKFLPWMAGALILPALVLAGAWLFSAEDPAPAAPAPAASVAPEPLDEKTANAACFVAMHEEFDSRADQTITGGSAAVLHITLSEPTHLNDAWTFAGVVEYLYAYQGTSTTASIGMTCTASGTKPSHTATAHVVG